MGSIRLSRHRVRVLWVDGLFSACAAMWQIALLSPLQSAPWRRRTGQWKLSRLSVAYGSNDSRRTGSAG